MIEWAIFVLLFIALVLQIITARRGPWRRSRADVFPVEPARTYPLEEIRRTAGPLFGHPLKGYGGGHVRIVQDEILEDDRWS